MKVKNLPKDVQSILSHFKAAREVQNGDLVIGLTVYRVTDANWGRDRKLQPNTDVEVRSEYPHKLPHLIQNIRRAPDCNTVIKFKD